MWNTMIESFNKGYLVAVCSEGIVGSNPNQGERSPAAWSWQSEVPLWRS